MGDVLSVQRVQQKKEELQAESNVGFAGIGRPLKCTWCAADRLLKDVKEEALFYTEMVGSHALLLGNVDML
jgi:hypothetical protein